MHVLTRILAISNNIFFYSLVESMLKVGLLGEIDHSIQPFDDSLTNFLLILSKRMLLVGCESVNCILHILEVVCF